jgi:hypothetical protein
MKSKTSKSKAVDQLVGVIVRAHADEKDPDRAYDAEDIELHEYLSERQGVE